MVIPYLGAASWYSGLLRGEPMPADRRHPNSCLIRSNAGPMRLSVPVRGGGRSLRSGDPMGAVLSDHGRWTHLHAGSIEANYGREPFFPHIFPKLSRIFAAPPATLGELNAAMHAVITAALGGGRIAASVEEMKRRPALFAAVARELGGEIDPALSILDAVMRLGTEALIPLAWECNISGGEALI